MKTKIYLAKSNRANPDEVSRVRSVLTKYPEHIELVEFKGGAYSHKNLKECDILVVVPDLSEFDDTSDDCIAIGKGLHEQIQAFTNMNRNKSDVIIIIEATDTWVSTCGFSELDLADCDDYVNYSTILIDTDGVSQDLDDVLKHRLDCDTNMVTNSSNESKYKYLVIGNK